MTSPEMPQVELPAIFSGNYHEFTPDRALEELELIHHQTVRGTLSVERAAILNNTVFILHQLWRGEQKE